MVVTPEDLNKKSDEEIIDSMYGAGLGTDHYKHCVTHLQLRYIRRTLKATKRLMIATWVLVAATVFLAVGAILPLVLKSLN
jgi:hypothetical protein